MINISEVLETNRMILEENLDVRTITMGISLLDCAKCRKPAEDVAAGLAELGQRLGLQIRFQRTEIFEKMHRV